MKADITDMPWLDLVNISLCSTGLAVNASYLGKNGSCNVPIQTASGLR